MNCSEFGTVALDIARHRPVDAAVRADAEAHASACGACREYLLEQETVTEHLAAWRTAARELSAPADVEVALVAAFRAQAMPSAETGPTARVASGRRASVGWVLAAAATLALVTGGALAGRWLVRDRRDLARPAPAVVAVIPPAAAEGVAPLQEADEGAAIEPIANEAPARATSARPPAARRLTIRRPQPSDAPRAEYVSLPAALPRWSDAPLVPVRLQLPYGALPALGLQVTREQWGETVPVEVLVGEDGIARGIRLVDNNDFDR